MDLERLGDEVLNRKMLLADLSENAKRLFDELSQFESCLLILHFLNSNAATMLTADDIAYHVSKPIKDIQHDLDVLTQVYLVETTYVTGVTFYHFTKNPVQRRLAQELCAWQDRWETRIRNIAQYIWGIEPSMTYVAQPFSSDSHSVLSPIDRSMRRWVATMTNAVNGEKNG